MSSKKNTRTPLALALLAALLLLPLGGCGGSSGGTGGPGGTDGGGEGAAPTNWNEIVWDQHDWQ